MVTFRILDCTASLIVMVRSLYSPTQNLYGYVQDSRLYSESSGDGQKSLESNTESLWWRSGFYAVQQRVFGVQTLKLMIL